MSGRSRTSGFIQCALKNGVGRYVCQLQRLTIKFCKSRAGSRGVRDFIENNIMDFTRHNPGIVIYLKPRRHRPAVLVGEYLNGKQMQHGVENYSQMEVAKWIEYLRSTSGYDQVRLRKPQHTDSPSIQGVWSPSTNRDTEINITEFPSAKLSAVLEEQSATEKLLELSDQLKKTE